MLSIERPQFEDELAVLCAGFDVPVTAARKEAYWRGLSRMQLGTFTRLVELALSEDGPEDLPTAPQLWHLYRGLRARSSAPQEPENRKPYDGAHALGQLCLLAFIGGSNPLTDGRGASQASLIAMIRAKDRIAAAAREDEALMRALATEDKHRTPADLAAIKDLRDVFLRAFQKLWQARTPEEIAHDFEHYQRTGRVRNFTDEELAQLRA